MDFRALRRRLTPSWLRGERVRHRRNLLFRAVGIQRSYVPQVLVRRPELLVGSPLRYVVADELLRNPEFAFLQIGAFDGVVADDLHEIILRHKLRGVLVEPQPAAFERLQSTYQAHPQLTLLRAAIAEREGTREFFCVRGRASVGASFDRAHLRKHGIRDGEIVAEQVVCHTVASALRAAGLEQVDLIQIDAEGFDDKIIRSIDFTKLRPAIVRFEHRHFSRADADACLELLAGHGYRFLVEERDIIALRPAAVDPTQATDTPFATSYPDRRRSA